MKQFYEKPLFFQRNRVGRVYTGGALMADFFGDKREDGFFPEEWIASSVRAINRVSAGEKEGVSRVRGTDWYLDDLLREKKQELLGDREALGVLTKVLDSAIRLPVQAHPDRAFSEAHFGTSYGKAESWLVLATRPDACIYFGFQGNMTKERFAELVEESRDNHDAMVPYLNRIPVKAGDVYLVPAKTVHAIGPGCLILEVQEPTDFTIQPEYYCGDYLLDSREMYLGLDKDTALDVFDYGMCGEKAVQLGRKTPTVLSEKEGVRREVLISRKDTPCFSVERLIFSGGRCELTEKPAVYVAAKGAGAVVCGGETFPVKKGDYFLLPFASGKTEAFGDEGFTLVCCLPPEKK